MNEADRIDQRICWIVITVLVLLVAGILSIEWIRAGVQAGVYRRQGIEMSQLEVFLGAKPAERIINIK